MTPTPSDLPKNTVLSQNPPADAQVDKGTTVDLTVSSGPQQVAVPNVISFDQQQATDRITTRRPRGRRDQEPQLRPARGIVVAVDPPVGTMVDQGSA